MFSHQGFPQLKESDILIIHGFACNKRIKLPNYTRIVSVTIRQTTIF